MLNKPSLRWTLLSVNVLMGISSGFLFPLIPHLVKFYQEASIDPFWIRAITSFSALGSLIGAFVSGYLVDKGRARVVLISSCFFFGGVGGLFYFIDHWIYLLVSRFLCGFFVAAAFTSSISILAVLIPDKVKRQKEMGIHIAFLFATSMLLSIFSGYFVQRSVQLPFLIHILPLLTGVFALLVIPDKKYAPEGRKVGSVFDPKVKSVFFRSLLIYFFGLTAAISAYCIPLYLPLIMDTSPTILGVLLGVMPLGAIMGSPTHSMTQKCLGDWNVFPFLFLIMAICLGGIYLYPTEAVVACLTLIFGFSYGTLIPCAVNQIVSVAPEKYRGRLVSGINMSLFAGALLAPFIFEQFARSGDYAQVFERSSEALLFISFVLALF